jgi:uncharacterized RDD family membrane protein YckC
MPPATPWRRMMCVAYECILLFGVLFFFGYGFSALAQFKGQPGAMRWAFQGFVFLVLAAYFTWSWTGGRRTLPMKTMMVAVVTEEGAPLKRGQAFLRFAAAFAMLVVAAAAGSFVHGALWLLILVPFLWVLVDKDHRALYDVVAGTRLVHVKR